MISSYKNLLPTKQMWLVYCILLTILQIGTSQNDSIPPKQKWLSKKEGFVLRPSVMVQLWGIYSTDFEVFNQTTRLYEPVDDRFNVSLRRARLLFGGEPYNRLKYSVALFYDQTGRDILTSGIGVSNRAEPNIGIWDAFFEWRMTPRSQALVLVGGWFRPQMQRESITSGWSVNSFEKSMSQNYVRNHLAGTGSGRAAGVNFGGLLLGNKIGLNYNIGIFNPLGTGLGGNSVGRQYSPLIAGRTVLYLGDPEMDNYRINYEINYFGRRKGVSLDFNFSTQGETDLFLSSTAYGPGILLNWGPLNLDGEWIFMQRRGPVGNNGNNQDFSVNTNSGHIRVGYNIDVGKYILEPVFMIMQFNGPMDTKAQLDALSVGSSAGNERNYNVGFNLYLDRRNLKVLCHYTFRNGEAGDAGAGALVNQFFNQPGVGTGAIRRGNWVGLGLNAIF